MQYLEGLIKIANVFLAIVAGTIAISILHVAHNKKSMRPWKFLIGALVLFSVQQILGALRAFQIFTSPFLTHIVPTAILGFLIAAIIQQIQLSTKK